MPLYCCAAKPKDAPRIAAIHMAAFASNPMLLAQFRTAAAREALQPIIAQKTLTEIEDANTTVLVVKIGATPDGEDEKDSELRNDVNAPSAEGTIIAFAKWAHPTESEEEEEEEEEEEHHDTPWTWPEGTAVDVLAGWKKCTDKAQREAMGPQACYSKLSRPSMIYKPCELPRTAQVLINHCSICFQNSLLRMASRTHVPRHGPTISKTRRWNVSD